jgi:Domain of unknown function (DUF2760)
MHGLWTRVKLAFAAFFTILFKGRLPVALQTAAPASPPPAAAPPVTGDPPDRAIQMLALLQRDGRLIDFLMEDLGTYSDTQIGTAVRDVHAGCRRALDHYISLESILDGREGEQTMVAQELDAGAVRLVGNVTGRPPFRGTLLHRGWRTSRVDLPPLGPDAGRRIVAQAEVEVP